MNESIETLAPTSSSPSTGQLVEVPLDQLHPNPFQMRADERVSIRQMADSIRERGVLQPIAVRSAPEGRSGYEIISGHRRAAALRLLAEEAATEEERRRFATAIVHLKSNVDDAQMALEALIENVQRVDLNPVELASGLENYRAMENLTPTALARKVGMQTRRVQRLLQVHNAPEFIKAACETGVLVPVTRVEGAAQEQAERRERRPLELMAAVALIQLYGHYENSAGPGHARRRVAPLVNRVLEEGWSLRRIENYCQSLISGKTARGGAVESPPTEVSPGVSVDEAGAGAGEGDQAEGREAVAEAEAEAEGAQAPAAQPGEPEPGVVAAAEGSGQPQPVWEWVGNDFVIHHARFQTLSFSEKTTLRALLMNLMGELR